MFIELKDVMSVISHFNKLLHVTEELKPHAHELYNLLHTSFNNQRQFHTFTVSYMQAYVELLDLSVMLKAGLNVKY